MASMIAHSAAPAPGAVRSRPSPVGPACSTSRAYAGSSAVAPPNSTANRSSEMAPSTIGRERTKRKPSSTVCQVAGAVLIGCGVVAVRLIRNTASSSSEAAVM
jgi:hypothetical protein